MALGPHARGQLADLLRGVRRPLEADRHDLRLDERRVRLARDRSWLREAARGGDEEREERERRATPADVSAQHPCTGKPPMSKIKGKKGSDPTANVVQ